MARNQREAISLTIKHLEKLKLEQAQSDQKVSELDSLLTYWKTQPQRKAKSWLSISLKAAAVVTLLIRLADLVNSISGLL